MTGRPAAACALYAAFLASWAIVTTIRRREMSPYLPLGMALLEAALVLGALGGLATGLGGSEAAVHAGYLLASILILPIGWALARTQVGLDPVTVALALAVLVVVILRVDATAA